MATSNNVKSDVLVAAVFNFDRETKGAVRYQEEGHAPVIGTLYLRKSLFATPDYPKTLMVAVTVKK